MFAIRHVLSRVNPQGYEVISMRLKCPAPSVDMTKVVVD